MSLSRIAARWLMRWTAHRPPPRHAEWALAMRREYDMLEGGELGWAIGCAAAMAGWKLRAQWLYLILLCVPPFLVYAVGWFEFELLFDGYVSQATFTALFRSYGPLSILLAPLPLAIFLGAYRPRSIDTTLFFGCIIAEHIGGTLYASFTLGGSFLSWWGPNATLYMMPPIVGLAASLFVWFIGAGSGALLARRLSSS